MVYGYKLGWMIEVGVVGKEATQGYGFVAHCIRVR